MPLPLPNLRKKKKRLEKQKSNRTAFFDHSVIKSERDSKGVDKEGRKRGKKERMEEKQGGKEREGRRKPF